MKRAKKSGFTLLEVVMSMMIISIISVGIYTGYMTMIKQTKDGQVKQKAALEGKKVVEALQGNSFTVPESTLNIDGITFSGDGTNFKRFLNGNYEDKDNNQNVTEDNAVYIETITCTRAQAIKTNSTNNDQNASENVSLNTNNGLNSSAKKFYVSRADSTNYISYDTVDDSSKKEIPLFEESNATTKKMQLSIFLTPSEDDPTKEVIEVFSYKGGKSLTGANIEQDVGSNIVINFTNYKNEDGTLPSNEDIEFDIYNKNSQSANVYLEKETNLNVDLEPIKGKINVYSNRSGTNDDVGTLYDFKVIIIDNNSKNILFTGYYKKNIHQ